VASRLSWSKSALALVPAILLLTATRPLRAQDLFSDVEYISGHAGMDDKVKGVLLVGESEIKFTKKDGTVLMAVPVEGITEVANQTDVRDASVGKKLLFGGLAGSRKQDFVQITYETADLAEGLVFKVKQGTATGVVAKIKFAVKRKKGVSPESNASSSNSSVPIQR
jgi:hypothetical protein